MYFLVLLWLLSQKELAASTNEVCFCDNLEHIYCCEHQNKTDRCSPFFKEDLIQNDSLIELCGEMFTLSERVIFENIHNVSLKGSVYGTDIICEEHANAGLEIIGSHYFEIEKIRLINCGVLYNSSTLDPHGENKFLQFTSSLYITNSTGIKLRDVSILYGNGTGLVMINSYGSVNNCKFRENRVNRDLSLPGGRGMYVELHSQPNSGSSEAASSLSVQNCVFLHNEALTLSSEDVSYVSCNTHFNSFGRGGGLALFMTGETTGIEVQIADVHFSNNKALWGGGMYIHFCKQAKQNLVQLTNVTFFENDCEYGGGAIDIGFTLLSDGRLTSDNSLTFDDCKFQHNSGLFGGGLALYSAESETRMNNSVTFLHCIWERNTAYYGSALDITPQLKSTPVKGDQPKITFRNATFTHNTLNTYSPNEDILIKQRKRLAPGRGTFLVAGQTIFFEDRVTFTSNNGTALYAISSILNFSEGTDATFVSNKGLYGGAISLIGYSSVKVSDDVKLSMINNSATFGGAIYHESFDKHDYLFSHNCFIQGSASTANSSFFIFSGNTAGPLSDGTVSNASEVMYGNDIFMTTLLPCLQYCGHYRSQPEKRSDIFNCAGQFEFEDEESALATSGAYFQYNDSEPLRIVPGKKTKVPFILFDDLNQRVYGVYHITTDQNIFIDETHTHTSEDTLVLEGRPGTNGNVTITKTAPREISLVIEVILEECPPFFKYIEDKKICTCAVNTTSKYRHIHFCHRPEFQSEILHGYWVGYEQNETKAENFKYGICPENFCFSGNESERFHTLPSNDEVDKAVCGAKRTGVLCGQCRSGYCAHYHSQTFLCGGCSTCRWGAGWILYVVTELLPLTLLFVLVIAFNVSFTSGYLNGFIFFSQVFDSVFSIITGFVYFPYPAYKLGQVIIGIYKLLNFDFFGNDYLSFCLWSEAKTIHLLSFKFLTVAYAAVLVVITVLVMKRCAYSNRLLCCTKSVSMIHGLTAFLVMVYTQCTNISFQLLNYVWVYDLDGHGRRVLFYQGDMDLFSKQHSPFAFLAILCLCSLTLIPPLFLISYPLCYRIAAVLRLENTKCIKLLGKLCPISKLKPVFDSFQGCFKDNYRHFAGLYFLYRVGLLASVLTSDPIMTFTFTQVQLSLILTIHCICWPYVKRIHNIIDALLFLNCSIINVITMLNYTYGQDGSVYQSTINVSTYIQLLFMYAPAVYLVVYAVYSIIKLCLARRKKEEAAAEPGDILLERLVSSDDEAEDSGNSYSKLPDTY